ncbi:MAG: O-linked GlcNAc transferase, partial [Planctomycetes bacterium]|nr:O-linked GlcNAc transferase [Planctomycetota bacterium]
MAAGDDTSAILDGRRIAFVGKLASMARRDAVQLARRHGATVLEKPDASVQTIVIGEADFPLPEVSDQDNLFDEAARRRIEEGAVEVITETQLWQRLGLVDAQQDVHRLYTPAMLADLLKVPVAVIRRWHRRGLIVPAR